MGDPRPGPVVIAVGGGKGGVGKSFVAANLGMALARGGSRNRVVAVDLDFGGSNLNLFLGDPLPERDVTDFLDGRVADLQAVAKPTGQPNLRYVAGSFDIVTAVDPLRDRKLDLVRAIVGLDADWVVLDLPAGSAPPTLDFFFLGEIKVVVTNPETTAFHNAYGFLKNYLLRRLLTEFRDRTEVMALVLDHYRSVPAEGTPRDRTVTGLAAILEETFPELAAEVHDILHTDAPLLVLNRVKRRRDRSVLDRFRRVVEANLGLRCDALGTIAEDRKVARAARDGRPFLIEHPRARTAREIGRWPARIAARANAGR